MKKFLLFAALALALSFPVEAKAVKSTLFVFAIVVEDHPRPVYYSPGGRTAVFSDEKACIAQIPDRLAELKEQHIAMKAYACVPLEVAKAMEKKFDAAEAKKNTI